MSDAPAPTDAAAAGAEAPAPRKRRLPVMLIAGVAVLLVLGGAGAWFAPKLLGAAPKAPPAEPKVNATVPLGAVVVNLSGETRRYLRVGVSLGLPDQKDGKAVEHHQAQLLDLVISVLAGAEIETLTSDGGKAKLKSVLLKRMREELHLEKVTRVYFTEFVIQ